MFSYFSSWIFVFSAFTMVAVLWAFWICGFLSFVIFGTVPVQSIPEFLKDFSFCSFWDLVHYYARSFDLIPPLLGVLCYWFLYLSFIWGNSINLLPRSLSSLLISSESTESTDEFVWGTLTSVTLLLFLKSSMCSYMPSPSSKKVF